MTNKISSHMCETQHIIIVGGGMVGLSLALMLADRLSDTINISLIEKCAFSGVSTVSKKNVLGNIQLPNLTYQPSFDARSTAISAGSAELLQSIDCWQLLVPLVESIASIHISDRGHYASTQLNATEQKIDALGYVVENRTLGHVLLQQLHQTRVNIIAPATVDKCRFTQHNVEIDLADNNREQATKSSQKLSADLLIIADGADSPLCQAIGIDTKITAYKQSAIIANVAVDKPHKGMAYERFTDQGPLALLPLADCEQQHRAALVWTRNSIDAEHLMSASDEQFLSELQQTMGYRASKITHVGERVSYPLALVQSEEQVRSRVVVMGNAAHFLHPVAGQGFNLSLRDCVSLADTLADSLIDNARGNISVSKKIGALSTLQQYLASRESDQQRTIALTDTMVNTFSSNALSRSIFRQCGLLSLNAMPVAKKILARQMMGLA
ncbi:MAG: 2-polyprenyl-6-methoxyphenol 4-hydroxylase [Candidatus Endobugula sp.]|jgi:2-polyprenyl-6-methoxyphenol 4-hydroxylase